MREILRRGTALGLVAAVALVSACSGEEGVGSAPPIRGELELIRGTRAIEEMPVVAGAYLAWTQRAPQRTRSARRTSDVYVLHGERVTKINRPGTSARTGGIADGVLVYQEIRQGESDLRLLRLGSRREMDPPAGVNTRDWEWHPTLADKLVLYGRIDFSIKTFSIMLADLATSRIIELDRVSGEHPYASPGQISGRFAVWSACPGRATCRVYLYDVQRRRTVAVPTAEGFESLDYAPSVDREGTIFFARSKAGRGGCGPNVSFMRFRRHDRQPSLLFRLPPGRDTRWSYAVRAGGGADVYFDRVDCNSNNVDILRWRMAT
jgi:hypothetical protein